MCSRNILICRDLTPQVIGCLRKHIVHLCIFLAKVSQKCVSHKAVNQLNILGLESIYFKVARTYRVLNPYVPRVRLHAHAYHHHGHHVHPENTKTNDEEEETNNRKHFKKHLEKQDGQKKKEKQDGQKKKENLEVRAEVAGSAGLLVAISSVSVASTAVATTASSTSTTSTSAVITAATSTSGF